MARKMVEVEFRLLLDHDDFTSEVQANFRGQLGEVTNCDANDIKIIGIRPGCINVKVRMPDDSAKQFLELFWEHCHSNHDLTKIPEPLRSFLNKYKVDDFTGRVDIDIHVKSNPTDRAVIFVHGWTGDNSTFGKWPAFLWDQFRCRSEVFEYPTGAISHSPSSVYVADALATWLRNHFADTKLALIAHSLGGIVVRRCIVSAQEQDDRLDFNVRNISFVASPHNGTILANLASKIPFLSSEQVTELKNSAASLYELNQRWGRWVRNYVPKSCRLQSYFGTQDKVVNSVNAIGASEDVIPILGRNHTNIVKPDGPDDAIVSTVARFLIGNRFFENDPKEEAQRRQERAVLNQAFYRDAISSAQTSADTGPQSGPGRPTTSLPKNSSPLEDG